MSRLKQSEFQDRVSHIVTEIGRLCGQISADMSKVEQLQGAIKSKEQARASQQEALNNLRKNSEDNRYEDAVRSGEAQLRDLETELSRLRSDLQCAEGELNSHMSALQNFCGEAESLIGELEGYCNQAGNAANQLLSNQTVDAHVQSASIRENEAHFFRSLIECLNSAVAAAQSAIASVQSRKQNLDGSSYSDYRPGAYACDDPISQYITENIQIAERLGLPPVHWAATLAEIENPILRMKETDKAQRLYDRKQWIESQFQQGNITKGEYESIYRFEVRPGMVDAATSADLASVGLTQEMIMGVAELSLMLPSAAQDSQGYSMFSDAHNSFMYNSTHFTQSSLQQDSSISEAINVISPDAPTVFWEEPIGQGWSGGWVMSGPPGSSYGPDQYVAVDSDGFFRSPVDYGYLS